VTIEAIRERETMRRMEGSTMATRHSHTAVVHQWPRTLHPAAFDNIENTPGTNGVIEAHPFMGLGLRFSNSRQDRLIHLALAGAYTIYSLTAHWRSPTQRRSKH
jgi:hypothetical protein